MTTNDDKILNDPTKQDCQAAFDELQIWVLLTIIVPSIVNVVIIGLFIWTLVMVRSFRQIADEIISSTHWLSRTTVRVGIGPSAKKALLDYAKTKPELAKLVGGTAGK